MIYTTGFLLIRIKHVRTESAKMTPKIISRTFCSFTGIPFGLAGAV
jgi:hypothetical protein